MASAGIATLLNKMGEDNVTVGIDGSVYRFHPYFHDLMTEKISQLQNHKVRLMEYNRIEQRNKQTSHLPGCLEELREDFCPSPMNFDDDIRSIRQQNTRCKVFTRTFYETLGIDF